MLVFGPPITCVLASRCEAHTSFGPVRKRAVIHVQLSLTELHACHLLTPTVYEEKDFSNGNARSLQPCSAAQSLLRSAASYSTSPPVLQSDGQGHFMSIGTYSFPMQDACILQIVDTGTSINTGT